MRWLAAAAGFSTVVLKFVCVLALAESPAVEEEEEQQQSGEEGSESEEGSGSGSEAEASGSEASGSEEEESSAEEGSEASEEEEEEEEESEIDETVYAPPKTSQLPAVVPVVEADAAAGVAELAVPSTAMGDLLAAYNTLRAFSWQLRLSPFSFPDFVAAMAALQVRQHQLPLCCLSRAVELGWAVADVWCY